MALAGDNIARIKAGVPLSSLIARRVKLTAGPGDRFGLCPFHREKTPSFTVNDGKGFYLCFGCAAHGDALDWLRWSEGLSFAEAAERLREIAGATPLERQAGEREGGNPDAARKRETALRVWCEARPAAASPAETYLREARGIAIDPLPDCLRFHPALRADPGSAETWPAMVAAVTDAAGEVIAVQRTFLTRDGRGKAPIERPKRALGALAGGAVRLAEAGGIVGLAEGIETGLSAMEIFAVPVWCALGSNLARIVLAPRIRDVAIFADRGEAGERAAAAACAAFRVQGRRVTVRFPESGHNDFNDEARARRDGA